ncbi:MAG TPA: hypothetical protein DG048_11200 [Pseudoalteromonas sp.]|nr:hypothetical protein [Pseudoalteromonas sp.]
MGKLDLHGTKYVLQDGTKAPSVTTIINQNLGWNKQVLINWAKRQTMIGKDADAVLRDAADVGTLLHILIEGHQRGFDVDTRDFSRSQTERAMVCFGGYLEWSEKTKFIPLKSEMVLVDEEQRIGGTIDCIGKIDDQLVLIDWKSSRFLYKEHKIQVAKYIDMYERAQPKASFEFGMVLRFDKEEVKFHQHKIDRDKIDAGIKIFDSLLELHNNKNSV